MSSEEASLNNSEEKNNEPSGEAESASPQAAPVPADVEAAVVPESSVAPERSSDDEETRPAGDVDFGQLLDQFEQEQASLQEGEVACSCSN